MHIEVQVALNFVISYLYNKLPRRRVNIFGEELEKALKDKFQGHWYPEKPYKGSAFRCLKTGDPIDKVLERAAVESGVTIQDILENLPQELAVWVDPGEVSYRIGEKGAVKILFSDKMDPQEDHCVDREVTKTFNPEAQCFRPIEAVANSMSQLSLSPNSAAQQQPPFNSGTNNNQINGAHAQQLQNKLGRRRQITGQAAPESCAPAEPLFGTLPTQPPHLAPNSNAPSPTGQGQGSFKGSPSPAPPFIPRTTTPLTFTTATFAQTKFGSTKLKTSSKRANRMSPTEFSNYIKHRAIQQQMQQQHHSPGGRTISPDPSQYYFHPQAAHYPPQQFPPRNVFESSNHFLAPEGYQNKFNQLPFEHNQMGGSQFHPQGGVMNSTHPPTPNTPPQENGKLMDSNWPYAAAAGPYQHLLLAN